MYILKPVSTEATVQIFECTTSQLDGFTEVDIEESANYCVYCTVHINEILVPKRNFRVSTIM